VLRQHSCDLIEVVTNMMQEAGTAGKALE